MVVVEKKECLCLFVHNVHFWQMLLTRLSIKTQQLAYVIILSNPAPFCLYILDIRYIISSEWYRKINNTVTDLASICPRVNMFTWGCFRFGLGASRWPSH